MCRMRAICFYMLSLLMVAPRAQASTSDAIDVEAIEENMYLFPDYYLKEIAVARHRLLFETTVYFEGSRQEWVPASLFRPKEIAPDARLPAVILQYGINGHRNIEYIVFHAAKLALEGFVVMVIDGPGRGERQPLPKGDSAYQHVQNYLDDYAAGLAYLAEQPYVNPERLSYVGISWGGISGITFAANEPKIKATVALGTGGRLPVLDPSYDPIQHVHKLAGRNLMLINGRFDMIINPIFSIALHRSAPEDTKQLWVNSGHYFLGYDQHYLNALISAFLLERMP